MQNRPFTNALGWLVLLLMLAAPAVAHKVKTSGDIGATQHIEPNDTPRAGETNLVWYALTRQGGTVIPLEQCNCELAVYRRPYEEGDTPIQKPPLKPISAEGYQNIPGADVTFPQVGAYDVVLRGTPKTEGNFQPFELQFDVTVAVGSTTAPERETIAPSPAPTSSTSDTTQPTNGINANDRATSAGWMIGIIVAVLIAGSIWAIVRQANSNRKR